MNKKHRLVAVAAIMLIFPTQNAAASSSVTDNDLELFAETSVFFGHQSVGENILSAIPSMYSQHQMNAPEVGSWPQLFPEGGITEAYIGENENPKSKFNDFKRKVAALSEKGLNVALMKLCFVDITAKSQVKSIFKQYEKTMIGLQNTYPETTFIYTTVPLTTTNKADNYARELYNQRIRKAFSSTGRLFDIAEVESTKPSGARATQTYKGTKIYKLVGSYSSDGGHLNELGAQKVAEAMIHAVARSRYY